MARGRWRGIAWGRAQCCFGRGGCTKRSAASVCARYLLPGTALGDGLLYLCMATPRGVQNCVLLTHPERLGEVRAPHAH